MQFTTLISLISLALAAPTPTFGTGAIVGAVIGGAAIGAAAVGIPALVISQRRRDRAIMQPLIPMGSVTTQSSGLI